MTSSATTLTLPTGRPARFLALGLLAAMVVVELGIVTFAAAASTDAVANAIVMDLTLGAVLVVWLLGVRRGGLPRVVLLPTFLAGLGLSHLLVGVHEPTVLDLLGRGAVAAELAVVVLILRGVGRGARALGREAGDGLVAIRQSVERPLGTGVPARLVASELAALWFATGTWRRPVPGYSGARRFAYGTRAGGIHAALIIVSVVEVVAVHLLVSRWSGVAAWILTALAVYGVLWILADLRAIRLRPTTLDDHTLVIRTGLRWTMPIPRDRIRAVERRDWRHRFGKGEDELSLAVVGEPDIIIELDRPLHATGPFGIKRTARRIGFSADRPDEVIEAIRPAD